MPRQKKSYFIVFFVPLLDHFSSYIIHQELQRPDSHESVIVQCCCGETNNYKKQTGVRRVRWLVYAISIG